MMPTRLQDGLSVSLLQWMRTAAADEQRMVVVRINDTETVSQITKLLENAGLSNITKLSESTLKGTVTAKVLSRLAHCIGICSITSCDHSSS